MANEQAAVGATKERAKAAFTDGFYHFGMVPASGMVDFMIPTNETTFAKSREFSKVVKLDAYDLWTNLGDGIRIYATKCGAFDSLGVRGFLFPSVSSAIIASGADLSITPYPGNVKWMRGVEAEAVAKSARRHFIRFSGRTGVVHDMAYGHTDIPAGYSKDRYENEKIGGCPDFDDYTDRYVADFVYLYKVEATDGVDRTNQEYLANPNSYHVRMAPALNKHWFDSPPKSISESYPQA